MRIVKVLLLTLTLALLSASAWADGAPTDPTVIFTNGGGSPTTTGGATASDPIFVTDGSGANDFVLLDPGAGVEYVEIVPFVGEDLGMFLGEQWNCLAVPPTATSCGSVPSPQGLYSSAVAQGLGLAVGACTTYYSDSTLACPAVEFAFNGSFYVGEDVSIQVPEPRTALLLCVGLGVLFAFGLKKRQAILA